MQKLVKSVTLKKYREGDSNFGSSAFNVEHHITGPPTSTSTGVDTSIAHRILASHPVIALRILASRFALHIISDKLVVLLGRHRKRIPYTEKRTEEFVLLDERTKS